VQVQEVGEELDIGKLVDRVTLLQNMVFVYRLVVQMARTVPQMTGRLPLFEKLERHSGRQSAASVVSHHLLEPQMQIFYNLQAPTYRGGSLALLVYKSKSRLSASKIRQVFLRGTDQTQDPPDNLNVKPCV
jgi:hypothetical protein